MSQEDQHDFSRTMASAGSADVGAPCVVPEGKDPKSEKLGGDVVSCPHFGKLGTVASIAGKNKTMGDICGVCIMPAYADQLYNCQLLDLGHFRCDGIPSIPACCPDSCEVCGGPACSNRPGGSPLACEGTFL